MRPDFIDAEVIEDQIVACPNCGQRNRILKQDRRVSYRCGSCRTKLTNPFAATSRFSQTVSAAARRLVGSSRLRVALVVFAVLALAVVGFNLLPDDTSPSRDDGKLSRLPPPSSDHPAESFQQVYPIHADPPLPPPRSLANGTLTTELSVVGKGTLKIDNGTRHDAVIKVVDEDARRTIVGLYVCAGQTASFAYIPDGNFRIIFASGTDWDGVVGNFTRDKSFAKFDEDLDFVTTRRTQGDSVYRQYSVFTLTLHRVVNGNAKTTNVGEDEFLKY